MEIKDQENDPQHHRDNDGQSLFSSHLVFIATRELVTNSRWNIQLPTINSLLDSALSIIYYIHFCVTISFIKEDITNKESLFTFDGLRSLHIFNVYQLPEWNLCSCRGWDQYLGQRFRIVTELSRISNSYRKSFSPLNCRGDLHATYGSFNGLLNIFNAQSISSDLLSVNVEMHVRFSNYSVSKDSFCFDGWNLFKDLLQLQTEILYRLQVRAINFDSHWGSHACLEHNQPSLDRLQLWS